MMISIVRIARCCGFNLNYIFDTRTALRRRQPILASGGTGLSRRAVLAAIPSVATVPVFAETPLGLTVDEKIQSHVDEISRLLDASVPAGFDRGSSFFVIDRRLSSSAYPTDTGRRRRQGDPSAEYTSGMGWKLEGGAEA